MCVCVYACACVCMCVYACMRVRACVCMCVSVIYAAKQFRQMNLISAHWRVGPENVRRSSCLCNENVRKKTVLISQVFVRI